MTGGERYREKRTNHVALRRISIEAGTGKDSGYASNHGYRKIECKWYLKQIPDEWEL